MTVSVNAADVKAGDQLLLAGVALDMSQAAGAQTVSVGSKAFSVSIAVAGEPAVSTLTMQSLGSNNQAEAKPVADFNALLATLSFNNTSDNPDPAAREYRLGATDATDAAQAKIAKFTVDIDPTNDEPTNITFVPGSVNENSAAGTVITTLDTTDLETSSGGTDTHTYELTAGYGDNEKVEIDGDKVKLVDGVNRSQATSEKTANNAGVAEEQLVTINGDTPSAGDSYVITVGGVAKATLEITDANKASYGDVASVRTELVSQLNTNLTGITAAPKTGTGAFDTDITFTADSAGTVIGSVVSSGADQHVVAAANTTNTIAASTDQVRLKIGDQTPHEGDGYSISVGGTVEASLTITSGNISSYGDVASVRDELISQLNGNLTGITAGADANASGFPMDIILTVLLVLL